MKRFDDIYELEYEQSVGANKSKSTLKGSVAKWFDEKGYFLEDKFEADLVKATQSTKKEK